MEVESSNIIINANTKQRVRNFGPKAKTGCLICKVRKVKCDEGTPSCRRCLQRRQTCAYINPKAKIFDPNSTLVRNEKPQIVPLSVRYGTSQETSSLAFFVKRTGPMLSMCSCAKTFWSVSVPQASWKFSAVRHMLVALSLLDQYLSTPMWTLIPHSEYLLALESYNKAIRELTCTVQPPGSILFASVLAWMFEGISNRPDVANLHISAATKIAAQLKADTRRYLSIEETEVVETLDKMSMGDSAAFLEWCVPEADYQQQSLKFSTLIEARESLAAIVDSVKSQHQQLRTDEALRDLRRWRMAFEAYRYQGIEPLAQKRQVFLHHNIIVSYVAILHFPQCPGVEGRQILSDVETLVDCDDVNEIGEGLLLLLNYLLKDENWEERPRAEKLLRIEKVGPVIALTSRQVSLP